MSRRCTIPVVALAAVLAASCTGAATHSPSAADPRAIGSAPPVAPRAAYKGWIAFDYRRAIWAMKADGSGRRQLTRPGGGNDFDPSWSPDGKRIVFRTSRGRYQRDPGGIGAEGIFVIDVATRTERQIQPPQGGLFPAWSPDGKTIAFSGTLGNPHEDGILLMNPDGTNVRDLGLPTGGNECATWSPDSSKLAFCHHGGDGNWAVWTVNADGSDPRQLTHPTLTLPRGSGGDSPGPWSPDGNASATTQALPATSSSSTPTAPTHAESSAGVAATARTPGCRAARSSSHTGRATRPGTRTGIRSAPTAPGCKRCPGCIAPATHSTGSRLADPRARRKPNRHRVRTMFARNGIAAGRTEIHYRALGVGLIGCAGGVGVAAATGQDARDPRWDVTLGPEHVRHVPPPARAALSGAERSSCHAP